MTTIGGTWMKPLDVGPSTRLDQGGMKRADAAVSGGLTPQDDVLAFFGHHGSSVFRFCRSTLGNASDAEDVVQDTFLKLLQHLQSGGDRSNLRAWLFTVAANGCRDRARGRRRWLPWQADLDRRTVEAHDEAPDLARARVALGALAARDRLLLSLRAQGLSYRELAAAAGIRETSVGRLLARAVARWKRRVDAAGSFAKR